MIGRSSGSSCPLVVVGAGTAGRAAAEAAASCGLRPLWIDDGTRASGVSDAIEIHLATRVLNINGDREILWSTRAASGTFLAEQIILATGSEPRTVPFPGWTLPGVIVGGGTSGLVERYPIGSRGRVLVVGVGPMLLERAVDLMDGGWDVIAVLDAAGPCDREDDRQRELRERIRGADVALRAHHAIFALTGTDHVQKAIHGPIDPVDWSPRVEQGMTSDVDRVVVEFGRVANINLAELARCRLGYDPLTESWLPERDERMRTSIPGIYAVGGSGVAFAMLAELQGRIAGISAAEGAGKIAPREAKSRLAPLIERLAEQTERRETLEQTCRPRGGLDALMNDGTVVCCCEDVRLRAIREAVESGARDMSSLKLMTRLGMGVCQARGCGATGARILAGLTRRSPENTGRIHARPPARPVTLGTLARMRREAPPTELDGARQP